MATRTAASKDAKSTTTAKTARTDDVAALSRGQRSVRTADGSQRAASAGRATTTSRSTATSRTASTGLGATTKRGVARETGRTIGTRKAAIDPAQARHEDDLVREHLPLVQYVVSEIAHRIPSHVTRSDLVSAGMLGLAQAARTFDPARGIAFDRFASTRIRGALLDELRGRDWASRSVRARARGMAQVSEELTAKLGRAPSPAEVATAMDLPADQVHKLVEDVHRATVLNYESLVLEGDAESFLAASDASPEDAMVARERRSYLTDSVAALPDRLRRVVIGYFFEERSMQDLADELGVSESRVSQLRAEALLLLKDGINSQLDPDQVSDEARPNGRVARRKAAYYAAVASSSNYAARLASDPERVQDKVARRRHLDEIAI
jgi:RNA polymerase sigma factor for flagellar operon FliA